MDEIIFTLTPQKFLIFTHDTSEMTHPSEILEISQTPQKNSSILYVFKWNGPL